jgi:hypothetical protein
MSHHMRDTIYLRNWKSWIFPSRPFQSQLEWNSFHRKLVFSHLSSFFYPTKFLSFSSGTCLTIWIYMFIDLLWSKMGIHGLQKFVEENLGLLKKFRLHDCNVLLDGNSIYHQMYTGCELTCLFGGEYDQFYQYCKQLFISFRICRIK